MAHFFHVERTRQMAIQCIHRLAGHRGPSENCNLCALAVAQAIVSVAAPDQNDPLRARRHEPGGVVRPGP